MSSQVLMWLRLFGSICAMSACLPGWQRLMLIMFVIMQAEVQSFYADGAIALHTRSLKYGKVSNTICL